MAKSSQPTSRVQKLHQYMVDKNCRPTLAISFAVCVSKRCDEALDLDFLALELHREP